MLNQFSNDSHVLSQVNKAPARSLDACLGEGVVASMPAPPFFLGGRLAGHQHPKNTLTTPHNLCALAGGRHGDRPPRHWPRPHPQS